MNYNPNIHHRRSIRLKGYDYSQAGLYFVTIIVHDRKRFFGEIRDGEMILNDAGIMIQKWWQKIPEKFPDIEMDVYQIMPNHFHAIVKNNGMGVGANPRVRPDNDDDGDAGVRIIGQTHGSARTTADTDADGDMGNILGEHMGSPVWRVVQWFKMMTTNEYIRGVKTLGWARFNGKLWQRNYYEHIIRNEQSYQNISNYIINNPAKWKKDKFFGTEPNDT